MKIKRGSTSVRRLIFIADTSKTDGSGLANLVYNSSGLVAYYFAGDLADEVQITLASATLGTWTSGGFIAVDNTNMPGWYELGIPNAALDGGNEVAMQLRGATNMAPVNIYIELDTVDYQTARFGAPTAADVTTAVYAALPADHTVAGSYGARFILALNSNRQLQLTGSNHAAADVHEFQTDVLTADAIAADAVTEIQGVMPDRLGYLLSILAGAISDAGTAAETYAITLNGSTFTVDYSGLDATGNRTGATLTKT
jgi:hypothetical protein